LKKYYFLRKIRKIGEIMGIVNRDEVSIEELGMMMGGIPKEKIK
jgi:hypothetical protein